MNIPLKVICATKATANSKTPIKAALSSNAKAKATKADKVKKAATVVVAGSPCQRISKKKQQAPSTGKSI
jgi:hypothetical protein